LVKHHPDFVKLHCAIGNRVQICLLRLCQGKKPQLELCSISDCVPTCQLRNKVVLENFTVIPKDGGRAKFAKKISEPHPLKKTYRMTPLSAKLNSMDSTFNFV
jgi:hypothetical protein